MKKLVMVFVGLLVFGIPGISFSDQGVTKDSVKIGAVYDLTGVSGRWGKIFVDVGDMWAKEVNSKGGIHGRKIVMVYGDNKSRADVALSEVKRLADFEKVFAFIGGHNSVTTMVGAPYAEQKKILWLFPIPSLPKYEENFHRYVFNLLPKHEPLSRVSVDYAMKTWNPKKLGVFYQFDEYGKTEFKNIKDQLAKYGLKVAQAEYFKKSQLSMSAEVARLKDAGCDVCITVGHTSAIATFLKEARRIGWDAHFMGGPSSSNYEMLKLAEGAAENMVCLYWFTMPDEQTEGWKAIGSLLHKYYPERKLGMPYVVWPLYDSLQRALELAGPNLTTDTLIKALETGFKGYTIGMYGPVNWSPTNHKGANSAYLRVVKNGKFQKIPGWEGFATPKE